MWGIGKRRSKLGRWLDSRGLTQTDLERTTKLSKNTISKACNDSNYIPSELVIKKILKAIRKIDSKAKMSNFWDM
ncbi:helix-turn-helix domain-containing protein [Bacillus cereus]|uniref:XRE family transcriptional regulator n=1 Tax=Bacillus cereus TaxID=1396 RepID=A0A9X5VY64_BACCE|nr:helix-turn-helix transcriptional regulator [Bacillus cereus]OLR25989.1 transcriptional regulator [Bacillus cereus]QDZ76632.1 XRE family transcriptional regulator [Bacillus cereus]